MTQILSQNIEFALAALIAVFMLILPKQTSGNAAQLKLNFLDGIAANIWSVLPSRYRDWLQERLNYCGWRSREHQARLASFKVYPPLVGLGLMLVLPPIYVLPILPALFFTADLVMLMRAKKRQEEIAASLPQAIDLMLLGVDAGLGLDATLQRIAADRSFVSNALNDELSRLGRDILLGVDRELAYNDLYKRTGVEELKSFASALNQSGKMGLSVSKILRAQSQFIRLRQSQKAEEKAAKLPIWMAFPLWFCIMPSLLLILLGPSLLLFFQQIAPVR